jgi:hypothetical protein
MSNNNFNKNLILGGVGLGALGIGLGLYWTYKKDQLPSIEPPEEPDPGKTTVYGVVIDSKNGQAIQYVSMTFSNQSIALQGSSNDVGIYDFSSIEPGTYEVAITRTGYYEGLFTIMVSEGNIRKDFVLVPIEEEFPEPWLSNLYATINNKNNEPIHSVDANLIKDGVVISTLTSDSSGELTFTELDPGEYKLSLSHNEYIDSVFAFPIYEGNNIMTFELEDKQQPQEDTILLWYGQLGGMPGYSGSGYATVWDANMYDLTSGVLFKGVPSGIKDLDVGAEFKSSGLEFLLKVSTWTPPGATLWSGWYLVKLPSYGEYAWKGSVDNGYIEGATNTENLYGMSADVIATITKSPSSSNPGPFAYGIRIDEIVSGDSIVFDIPISLVIGDLPTDEGENLMVRIGDTILLNVILREYYWQGTVREILT